MSHSFEMRLLFFTVELLRILPCVGLIGDFVGPSNGLDLSRRGEQTAL